MIQSNTTQSAPEGFFSTAFKDNRWWLTTPEGKPFFSLGLNHFDPAGYGYDENVHIWYEKYHNSMEEWLAKGVRPRLESWGFNTLGWEQELVMRHPQFHKHSRSFTFEEYQWLGLPYTHMIPIAETHYWDSENRHPDFTSSAFEDWCDYLARAHCVRFRDDPKLIGYYFTDCPTWTFTKNWNEWKGPLFDPEQLKTEAGKKALHDLTTHYYRVVHDAIRRYDPHHLIMGDRYEANHHLPEIVVRAAVPYVDVLSFQCFSPPERLAEQMSQWADVIRKPLLVADSNGSKFAHGQTWDSPEPIRHDPAFYPEAIRRLRDVPACVGFHLCGAFMRNKARNRGLISLTEEEDAPVLAEMRKTNAKVQAWIDEETSIW